PSRRPVGEPLLPSSAAPSGNAIAFGAGRTLASAGSDGFVRLWDAGQRRQEAELRAPSVSDVAFSPDGQLLAAATGDGAVVWNVASRRPVGRPFSRGGRPAIQVAFSPDGRLLAAAGIDAVSVWDVRTRSETPLPGRAGIAEIAFDPDGRHLAIARTDGPVELWDVRAPQSGLRRLPVLHAATAIAFS